MSDEACIRFLQWCLPQLGFRWPGYRKVRGTVCKRLKRRLCALELPDFDGYRVWINEHPDEWAVIDQMFRIQISRFYRNRRIFATIGSVVLPKIARAAMDQQRQTVTFWSAGCASGEEPYSVILSWHFCVRHAFPDMRLEIIATDAEVKVLERARRGCFSDGSLRELPSAWRDAAFVRRRNQLCLKPQFRRNVRFRRQDLRYRMPAGPFDLVMCRNLAFTYFDATLRGAVAAAMVGRLRIGGFLVVGAHESVPQQALGLRRLDDCREVYARLKR